MHKKFFFITICLLSFHHAIAQQLSNKFYGQWVNTSLFDSTAIKKKISPWINEFYVTAVLNISPDTITLYGCMDGGPIEKITKIDPRHFTTSSLTFAPKFEYVERSDLIKMTTKRDFLTVVFRRVKPSDRLDIITDEKQFEKYFRSLFFDSYIKAYQDLRIDKLWIGFETHTPFAFDAFGVRKKDGNMQYFGWEIEGQALRIYETIRHTNNDSGFYYWTKGKLLREMTLK